MTANPSTVSPTEFPLSLVEPTETTDSMSDKPGKPNRSDPQPTGVFSRRELIRSPLVNQANRAADSETAVSSPVVDSGAGPLMTFSANAMGCEFQVLCSQPAMQPIAEAVQGGFDLLHSLESRLTIFSDSSEMAFLNRTAYQQPVALEAGLFQLLQTAQAISGASGGAFDLSATALTRLWKQHRSNRTLPSQSELDAALQSVGFEAIQFDANKRTVAFNIDGLQLDLGGIGKGYALDCLSEHLAMSDCCDFLIHGGQSSVICNGQRSSSPESSWQVGITHPLSPAVRLAMVELNGRAIGTSGSGRKSYVVGGKRYGHIIDPRTGHPADELLSVTVLADSAMLADALATTIFVTGPEMADSLCHEFKAAAILVSQVNPRGDLQIETCCLPESDLYLVHDSGH